MLQRMTPARALIAGLLGAVIFAAGLFIVAGAAGSRPHDLLPLLSIGRAPFVLWCFLAAWGASLLGAIGILTAFLAFLAHEDEDEDGRYPRRGFPKALPPFLIAVALGLAYLALACGARTGAAAPIAVPATPDAVEEVEAPLLGAEPAPPAPTVSVAAYQWGYMDPLVRDAGGLFTGTREPFADEEAETRRLLCGKAWVAVSGSASEEGPPARNEARSRLRTARAMQRAARWIEDHPQCGATVVLGLDLGQHAQIAAADHAATAYQRQILVAARARGEAESALSAAAAEAELRSFLADPANRTALYAGRDFRRDPVIVPR